MTSNVNLFPILIACYLVSCANSEKFDSRSAPPETPEEANSLESADAKVEKISDANGSSQTQDHVGFGTEDQSLSMVEEQKVSSTFSYHSSQLGDVTFNIVNHPQAGEIEINSVSGEFTYTPDPNYHGIDSFTFLVFDKRGQEAEGTVNLTIIPVNDSPMGENIFVNGQEDTKIPVQLLGFDVDNLDLEYSIDTTNLTNGSIADFDPKTGKFFLTPNADFFGQIEIPYSVSDGEFSSALYVASIAVQTVNDVPTAMNSQLSVAEDSSLSGTLLASDIDSQAMTFSITTMPTQGTIASFNKNTGEFVYLPGEDYHGEDKFSFTATDSLGGQSETADVSLVVTPVSDHIVPSSFDAETNEDTTYNGQFIVKNVDNLPHKFTIEEQANLGTLKIIDATKGTFEYKPKENVYGLDSFTYSVKFGNPEESHSATVSVNILQVNDAPQVEDKALVMDGNSSKVFTLNVQDIDSEGLIYQETDAPSHGSLTIDNSLLTYTPSTNYFGSDQFRISVSDGEFEASAIVSVMVNEVNIAPVAQDDPIMAEASDPILGGQLKAADFNGDPLTFVITKNPNHGTVILTDANLGKFDYIPNKGYGGPDSFSFKANDGSLDSNVAIITIDVTPNSDPVVEDLSLKTDSHKSITGQIVASDSDADTLQYSIVRSESTPASVGIDQTGMLNYDPNGYIGIETFLVAVFDGHVTVFSQVSVEVINVAVVACATQPQLSMTRTLHFDSADECRWGQNGNLGKNYSTITAREGEDLPAVLDLPENSIICEMSLKTLEGAPQWRYDDQFLITIDNYVLIHSDIALVRNTKGSLIQKDGIYIWDFSRIKGGKRISGDSLSDPCLGNGTCIIPDTDTDGILDFSLDSESMSKIASNFVQVNKLNFHVIVTGDNDGSDCQHSGLDLSTTLKYVVYP